MSAIAYSSSSSSSSARNAPVPTKPKRTFYRRPLPEICTALSSPEGRAIFSSAHASHGLKSFFPLMEQFSTQIEPAYCGPTTLVVILNALAVDPRRTWKGPWRWYEEAHLNCCVDLEEVKKTGITFGTFACLARCQGLTVEAHLGSESSVDDFRKAVKKACVENATGSSGDDSSGEDDSKFLAVSYTRKVVGQTGDGHFSPVAAYDEASDSLLVLDTARFKYGPHWIPLQVMYDALQPVDTATGKSRGYALLSYHFNDTMAHSGMPRSVLFRSNKAKDPVRRLYKSFLAEHYQENQEPLTFEHVLDFWTKGGENMNYIWSIFDPQLAPTNEEEEAIVENARALIQKLIRGMNAQYDERLLKSKPSCVDTCAGSTCNPSVPSRNISVSPLEAIFVVYLSSLQSDERRKLVYRDRKEAFDEYDSISNVTHEQIICEAELIQYAIEASDEDDLDK
mmetsp:Transcript_14114/g.30266  ORF Transcript_14114/g.30266 Transcript_14114/m.30266 type:complete len:452 (+) Transcript_14114:162-1517(+)